MKLYEKCSIIESREGFFQKRGELSLNGKLLKYNQEIRFGWFVVCVDIDILMLRNALNFWKRIQFVEVIKHFPEYKTKFNHKSNLRFGNDKHSYFRDVFKHKKLIKFSLIL